LPARVRRPQPAQGLPLVLRDQRTGPAALRARRLHRRGPPPRAGVHRRALGRRDPPRVAARRARPGMSGLEVRRARPDELARGLRELVLNAQVAVIAFYERLGYRVEGPEFLEAGIPHRAMRKPLT